MNQLIKNFLIKNAGLLLIILLFIVQSSLQHWKFTRTINKLENQIKSEKTEIKAAIKENEIKQIDTLHKLIEQNKSAITITKSRNLKLKQDEEIINNRHINDNELQRFISDHENGKR